MKRTVPRSLFLVGIVASLTSGVAVRCWAGGRLAALRRADRPIWTQIDFVGHCTLDGPVAEHKDLSGIALLSPTRGLIGTDEGGAVQVIELSASDRALRILHTINLSSAEEELDIEAIASEGAHYYIVGSHGVAKKSGSRQPSRYRIFRLRADPLTGMPVDGRRALSIATLSPIFEADPTLKKYFAKPLQDKGVNIEGLAVRDGRLFVGLRNPNLEGSAFVIEVAAEEVFAPASRPTYRLHGLPLGEGLGIREIVTTRSGFLIIAGNAGSEPSRKYSSARDFRENRGFWMFTWDGKGSDAHRIGRIPNAPGKAEAMTILQESADGVTVLILFDGAPRGRPSLYRIH